MAREDITSQFPTIGSEGYHTVVNLSGKPSRNTMMQPRDAGGATQGNTPGTGTKGNRSGFEIKEANGPPANHVLSVYRWPDNAASALEVQRNVRLMPSAMGGGNSAFWSKRSEGPVI